jgi:hypothetical protein
MINFINKLSIISIVFFMVFFTSGYAFSAKQKLETKITGFSTVKSSLTGKAYFYKEPKACETGKKCHSIRKAYLIANDFVQTGPIKGQFVWAVFRDFDGYGGRETAGWLLLDDLNPIRKKLELKDLTGDWTQMNCEAGDDCGISISVDKNNKFEIFIDSHIHEHPGFSFFVDSIKMLQGKFLLTGMLGGESNKQTLELVYDSPDLEPGTISLSGDEFFNGVYLK